MNYSLNEREVFYIKHYNCQFPNGLNLTSGGSSQFRHSTRSIELMKEQKHKNINNTRHENIA